MERERVNVGQVVDVVRRIVLEVEPASYLCVAQVTEPARRVERGRSGVRGAGLAPARVREQSLRLLEGQQARGSWVARPRGGSDRAVPGSRAASRTRGR